MNRLLPLGRPLFLPLAACPPRKPPLKFNDPGAKRYELTARVVKSIRG